MPKTWMRPSGSPAAFRERGSGRSKSGRCWKFRICPTNPNSKLKSKGESAMTTNTLEVCGTLPQSQKTALNYTLWTVQVLLAALFLFAGIMKLVLPIEAMTQQIALPGPFLRFIGVAETLGGLGLILPGLAGIRRGLTPLAAAGLVVIMAGATVVTLVSGGGATSLIPLVVGLLAGLVCYGRLRSWLPDRFRVERSIRIQAPPEDIAALIQDFRAWRSWSPYEQLDPAMNRTYSGEDRGRGAI